MGAAELDRGICASEMPMTDLSLAVEDIKLPAVEGYKFGHVWANS